jgi:hypothetical protein
MTVAVQLDADMLNGLKDIMGDDFTQLVDAFRLDSKSRIDCIERGLASKTAELVRASAHSFKGSSANMGASMLSQYCHQLELSASANDLDAAAKQLQIIKAELAQINTLLVAI